MENKNKVGEVNESTKESTAVFRDEFTIYNYNITAVNHKTVTTSDKPREWGDARVSEAIPKVYPR